VKTVESKEEWKKIIEMIESEQIQNRLSVIRDDFIEKGMVFPLRYEHMTGLVFKMLGIIYAKAYSMNNLTSVIYVRSSIDISDRIEKYDSELNKLTWDEIGNSMPENLLGWVILHSSDKSILDSFTIKEAEDFLDYLRSEAFYETMNKVRKERVIIRKSSN
jgi:hypothetical protein